MIKTNILSRLKSCFPVAGVCFISVFTNTTVGTCMLGLLITVNNFTPSTKFKYKTVTLRTTCQTVLTDIASLHLGMKDETKL